MKRHAAHIGISGLVGPLALALATLIANEAQTLLGLHLDNVALAIYLVPFLLGAAHILRGQLALEAKLLLNDPAVGKALASLLGGLATPAPKAPPRMPDPAPGPPPAPPKMPPDPFLGQRGPVGHDDRGLPNPPGGSS